MAPKSNSWKLHFDSLPTDEAGNKNMQAFSSSMEAGNPNGAKLAAFTGNPDVVLLGADGDEGIRMVHSLKNLGGNVLRPTDNVVGLLGFGPKAIPVELDVNSATLDVKLTLPSAEQLRNCKLKEEFEAVEVPRQTSSKTLKSSASFLAPPFLRTTLIQLESDDLMSKSQLFSKRRDYLTQQTKIAKRLQPQRWK